VSSLKGDINTITIIMEDPKNILDDEEEEAEDAGSDGLLV
jgi:hypothetical protein